MKVILTVSKSQRIRSTATTTGLFGLLLATPFGPAQADENGAHQLVPGPGPVDHFYIVTRIDTRKCVFPLCGGVFVKQVNRGLTTCADGQPRPECHATITDFSRLGLDPATLRKLTHSYEQGQVLVRGKLFEDRVDELDWPVKTLDVEQAWRGASGEAPEGVFARIDDSGIVCVTHPCPIYDARYLNTRFEHHLSALDLAATGAPQTVIDDAFAELFASGILVAGHHFLDNGPAGTMLGLRASEFYTRVVAENPTCSLKGERCGKGEYCLIEPGLCTEGEGVCVERPDACLHYWDPVCGCDGRTYSNAGCAAVEGVSIAHEGACECAPMEAKGVGPCDLFLGYKFDGQNCVGISGCECEGSDCDQLFSTQRECYAVYGECMIDDTKH